MDERLKISSMKHRDASCKDRDILFNRLGFHLFSISCMNFISISIRQQFYRNDRFIKGNEKKRKFLNISSNSCCCNLLSGKIVR